MLHNSSRSEFASPGVIDASPTVFIVDDDAAARDGIRMLLRTAGIESESFESAESFLAQDFTDRHGCAIIDLRMPGLGGMDLYREMRTRRINLPAVFLTAYGDVPIAVEAMRAGASDFLEKPFRPQALLDAVQRAFRENQRSRDESLRRRTASDRFNRLTPREREVMRQFIQGWTTERIAQQLDLSHKTVYAHRANIMKKAEVSSLAELVRVALDAGLRE